MKLGNAASYARVLFLFALCAILPSAEAAADPPAPPRPKPPAWWDPSMRPFLTTDEAKAIAKQTEAWARNCRYGTCSHAAIESASEVLHMGEPFTRAKIMYSSWIEPKSFWRPTSWFKSEAGRASAHVVVKVWSAESAEWGALPKHRYLSWGKVYESLDDVYKDIPMTAAGRYDREKGLVEFIREMRDSGWYDRSPQPPGGNRLVLSQLAEEEANAAANGLKGSGGVALRTLGVLGAGYGVYQTGSHLSRGEYRQAGETAIGMHPEIGPMLASEQLTAYAIETAYKRIYPDKTPQEREMDQVIINDEQNAALFGMGPADRRKVLEMEAKGRAYRAELEEKRKDEYERGKAQWVYPWDSKAQWGTFVNPLTGNRW